MKVNSALVCLRMGKWCVSIEVITGLGMGKSKYFKCTSAEHLLSVSKDLKETK